MIGTVEFPLEIPGGPQVTLVRSVISGSSRLRGASGDIPRSDAPGRPFHVPIGGGRRATVHVHGRGYDYVPQVVVDGKEVAVARGLALWEYGLAALPLTFTILFYLVGAIVGFAAMAANQWVLRTGLPLGARVGITLGITVAAFAVDMVVWLAVVAALRSAGLLA